MSLLEDIRWALRIRAFRNKVRIWFKEGTMLPDGKPAYKSKTIMGHALKSLGLIIAALGVVLAGEAGWDHFWQALTRNAEGLVVGIGALAALIGSIVQKRGEREAMGRIIVRR
jgi:hypothetical protein